MSVESAVAYIKRMREDAAFRQSVNETCGARDDEEANWAFLKELGYEFSHEDFLKARDVIYQEFGIAPKF